MDRALKAAVDAIRDRVYILSVSKTKGRAIIRLRTMDDLAQVPGRAWIRRTAWGRYPAVVYKLYDGIEFRVYLRAVPRALLERSIDCMGPETAQMMSKEAMS